MPTTSVNGTSIHWELAGEAGEPLVLVHGSWGDKDGWSRVLPSLSRNFRVLAYDRRGHSRSERPPGQGSVREDVADLAALLDVLGHRPAHIVGSSFGASIVLRLATERPELFRSLVAHEPPLFGLLKGDAEAQRALAASRERIAQVVALLERGDAAAAARQFVETISLGPGAWATLPEPLRETYIFNAPTWLDEMRDANALEFDLAGLHRFTAPALLTLGDQSAPFFPPVVKRLAAALPNARMHVYAGGGHVPHASHPAEYVQAVTEFVNAA